MQQHSSAYSAMNQTIYLYNAGKKDFNNGHTALKKPE